MCCKFKSRRHPSYFLAFLSTLVLACGILIIYMTVDLIEADLALRNSVLSAPAFQVAQDAGATILMLCAVLSIAVAFAGCAAVKVSHRCYIMVYGCCLGSIWIAVFIVGCVFAATADAAPMITNQLCVPQVTNPKNSYENDGFGRDIMVQLNGNMCSATCPCPPSAAATYENMTETSLNFFNRSKSLGQGNTTAGYTRMYYQDGGDFKNFTDCYNANLSPAATDEQRDAMTQVMKIMQIMEPKFSCSGICNPGLFWFTLPVGTTPPTKNCITFMADAIGGKFTPIGLVAILSGVIMAIIWLFQYVLWCRFHD